MYFVDADLQDDVDEVGVLEHTVELNYIEVVQSFVDLYFGEQLE